MPCCVVRRRGHVASPLRSRCVVPCGVALRRCPGMPQPAFTYPSCASRGIGRQGIGSFSKLLIIMFQHYVLSSYALTCALLNLGPLDLVEMGHKKCGDCFKALLHGQCLLDILNLCIHVYIYIYIYIERERYRERERDKEIY